MSTPSSRQLFGGAILANIPPQFVNVSDIREVPDNQEVFADAATDQSFVIEILEYVTDASDEESASFHFSSVAYDNEAEDSSVVHQSGALAEQDVPHLPPNTPMFFVSGQQLVTKFRERDPGAHNLVNIFLAVIRLPEKKTDIVITYNIPVLIGATSSSRETSQEGNIHEGFEDFKKLLASIQIIDWELFV